MGDRKCVRLRRVVRVDRVVVPKDDERRSARAGGQQQRRRPLARQRATVDAPDTQPRPFGERLPRLTSRRTTVARGQADLVAPWPPTLPARALEVVGGRPERVGHRSDDVAPAVAVEVHRDLLERGRHELRLAEGARPGTHEQLGRDVAVLQDAQRGDQLAAKKPLPAAEARDGRQRAHQGPPAANLAVIGLDAPDCHDGVPVDAELLFDVRQHRGPLLELGAAFGDALLVHQHGEVIPDRLLELRLVVHRVEHGLVGLDARQRLLESLCANAAVGRLGAHVAQARVEIRGGRRPRRDTKS